MHDPPPPIITLTTDFGTTDAYVGVMKGVILARAPQARIVDLSHEVPPQDLRAARYLVETSWRFFRKGTVHVVVVDPGVGSERKILAASAVGQLFLAPDNGLLAGVLESEGARRVVSVENAALFLHPVSRTFHGRDIFAPVAAALAGGTSLEQLGPELKSWTMLPASQPVEQDGCVRGEVVWVDRFGNLVTDIDGGAVGSEALIEIAGRTIRGLASSYSAVAPGEFLAVIGSSGRLEVSVAGGDARTLLGVSVGTPVVVILSA